MLVFLFSGLRLRVGNEGIYYIGFKLEGRE